VFPNDLKFIIDVRASGMMRCSKKQIFPTIASDILTVPDVATNLATMASKQWLLGLGSEHNVLLVSP
jgi:hypothetical protein